MENYLRAWRESRGLTQEQLAELARPKATKGEISKLENTKRRLTPDWLQRLAPAFDIEDRPARLFDPPEVAIAPGVQGVAGRVLVGERADLPVYGSAEGGPTGMLITYDPIEYVKRPEPLLNVKGGFGFYVFGESMSPRYDHGDLLLVHPTKPCRRGDYALIVLNTDDGAHAALVKRFVGWEKDALILEQLNPAKRLDPIPRKRIHGVHKIVGMYER